MPAMRSVSAGDLAHLDTCRTILLDVRTVPEYRDKHLKADHAFVPLDILEPKLFFLKHGLDSDTTVYTLCSTGSRAKIAAEKFLKAGFTRVGVVEGGLDACASAGVLMEGSAPQAHPGAGISLERQVRIAVGSLILLSFVLAAFIHPYFLAVAIFLAGGLIFSGITNYCGVALLLMKAPWNASTQCGLGGSCGFSGSGAGKKGQSCQ